MARIPPTINVEDDWRYFDNLQPVKLQNQKQPIMHYVEYALQEGVDTIMADMGDGTIGFRTFCTWHVWRNQLNGFIPQINCCVTDKAGNKWYVANVNLHVWGNKYQLDCELQAGKGVLKIDLPVNRSTPVPLPTVPATPQPTPNPTSTPTPTPTLAYQLWAWGSNNNGQLGNDQTISKSMPTFIRYQPEFDLPKQNAGFGIVKVDGTAWVWGINGGRLGLNIVDGVSSPTQLGTENTWSQLKISGVSLGIKKDGTLWGWGNNTNYAAGLPTNINYSSPVQIGIANTWAKIVPAAGNVASFAIKNDGTLWFAGLANAGQAGNNDLNQATVFTQIGTDTNWNSVSFNNTSASVAVKKDGTLWTTGGNSFGELGQNDLINRSSWTQVGTSTNWVDAFASNQNCIAINNSGKVYGWGRNFDGVLGQNNTLSYSSPVIIAADKTWSKVLLSTAFVGLTTTGQLWTAGLGSGGQLGNNSSIRYSSLIQTVISDNNWIDIYSGSGSSNVFALRPQFAPFPATPTPSPTPSPTPTATPLPTITPIAILTNGNLQVTNANPYYLWTPITNGWNVQNLTWTDSFYINSVFDVLTDGQVVFDYNIGNMADGNIGVYNFNPSGGQLIVLFRNTTGSRADSFTTGNGPELLLSNSFDVDQTVPFVANMNIYWRANPTPPPTASPTPTPTPAPSMGYYTWGFGTGGVLGNNTTTTTSIPNTLSDDPLLSVAPSAINLTAGVVKNNGTLWIWGGNAYGVYGNGSLITASTPVQVDANTNWYSVSTGTLGTLAVKTNGTLWGSGDQGVLGLAASTKISVLQQIGVGTNWERGYIPQISTGSGSGQIATTYAIRKDGTIWVTGLNVNSNQYGSFGNNNTTNSNVFIQGASGMSFAVFATDHNYNALGIDFNGRLWGWGRNLFGELSQNTTTPVSSPVLINASTTWKSIAFNKQTPSTVTAVKTDGTLWSWGRNDNGQVGNNTSVDISSMVQIGTATDWDRAKGGNAVSAAIKKSGALWIWGQGANGRLGNGSVLNRSSPVQTTLADTKWIDVDLSNTGLAIRSP